MYISKVRGNGREFFQRDASDSNAWLHHSAMLPVFPSYHGTKILIFFSKFIFIQKKKKKYYKTVHIFSDII